MIDKRTDIEKELERIRQGLAELNGSALSLPVDSATVSRLAYLQYQRASLTGDLDALGEADATLDYAIRHLGPSGDLYFLKANIHFKLHRLNDVESDLRMNWTSYEHRGSSPWEQVKDAVRDAWDRVTGRRHAGVRR